jgi:SAM-dependent methyltransferase
VEDKSFWFKHRSNCIIELLKRFPPRNNFVEIGAGNGFVTKCIEDAGFATIALEPGADGAYNAKKRGLINVICATLELADFYPESFSGIGLFDVLEHIERSADFLKNIHSVLEKDGLIFITVPAYNFLWSLDDVHAGHFRRYTTQQLEEQLNMAGFRTVYSTYIFQWLPIPIFLMRTMPWMLSIKQKVHNINKVENDHVQKGAIDKLLNVSFSKEITKIKNGKAIPFGGSCLLVAKKFLI